VTGGRELLVALKATTQGRRPVLVLPVGDPPIALLRPVVTSVGSLDSEDVSHLTEWRNRFRSAFLHEFEASTERTARWLRTVVGPDDSRLLFMIDDPGGRTFGYVGLAFIDWKLGYGEADSVVRGRDAPPGTMVQVVVELRRWARAQLGLRTLGVRVRSDNPALSFYRRVGFEEVRRTPLKAVAETDGVRLVEALDLDLPVVELVHMRYTEEEGV
jgi:GNAT superfamily N-acetyltransferase